MIEIEIRTGSRAVIATSNGEGAPWTARLYVNGGETVTLTAGRSKTEAGIRKWAAKVLAA